MFSNINHLKNPNAMYTTAMITTTKFGAVAIQQALVKHFCYTIRRAAGFAQVHPRTLHSHVQAKFGSKVTAWENRSVLAQSGAIETARALIIASQQRSHPLAA